MAPQYVALGYARAPACDIAVCSPEGLQVYLDGQPTSRGLYWFSAGCCAYQSAAMFRENRSMIDSLIFFFIAIRCSRFRFSCRCDFSSLEVAAETLFLKLNLKRISTRKCDLSSFLIESQFFFIMLSGLDMSICARILANAQDNVCTKSIESCMFRPGVLDSLQSFEW
jgi:hypothetical protein